MTNKEISDSIAEEFKTLNGIKNFDFDKLKLDIEKALDYKDKELIDKIKKFINVI